tara:strand:+ start:461 stop:1114 length:654 start_codon:yes stop_codon:yes gene_type:complete
MKNILIISPHPDDETLGCGGLIHRLVKEKKKVNWLNVTKFEDEKKNKLRLKVIKKVIKSYKIHSFTQLNYITTKLNSKNLNNLIKDFNKVINVKKIDTLFIPFLGDIHSDHYYVSKASLSASKVFRSPSIKKIFCYETLSETNLNFAKRKKNFNPNSYFDITNSFQKKLKTLKLYKSELSKHPFPRSIKSVESLSILRGSESGFKYAEAYEEIFSRL